MSGEPGLDRPHVFLPADPSSAGSPLLLLHGTGGDEHSLLPLRDHLSPGAAVLSVRGTVLENGMPRFFRRIREGVFDEDDLRRRADDLAEFVQHASAAYGIEERSLIAVGFSNGANIASALLLERPGLLAGAVLLAAMMPFAEPPEADLSGHRGRDLQRRTGSDDPGRDDRQSWSGSSETAAPRSWSSPHPGGHQIDSGRARPDRQRHRSPRAAIHPPEKEGLAMRTYQVGYFVGSLSSTSINRILSKALIKLAPEDLEFTEIPIDNLPLYSPDYDDNYPPEALALKEAINRADAVLFVTPEYNRSIPGALKNAIDWASRPWGTNAFDHIPAAVIGASIGQIGTALAQQSLRHVLSFCNARQMTAPEAYIQYSPEIFQPDGTVTDESTAAFLSGYMADFREHIARVLTVIPRKQS